MKNQFCVVCTFRPPKPNDSCCEVCQRKVARGAKLAGMNIGFENCGPFQADDLRSFLKWQQATQRQGRTCEA